MARFPFKKKRIVHPNNSEPELGTDVPAQQPPDVPTPVEDIPDPVEAPESPPETWEAVVRSDPPFEADERIERGLLATAAFHGNTRKASEFLAADGMEIHHSTLWHWKNGTHAARYEEIRAERLPQVQRAAAERHMELLARNMDLEGKLLDDLDAKRHELAARDISTAARNAAVGTGIHTEKAQLMNEQPTAIQGQKKSASELLRQLKAKGIVIDAEVTEEEDVDDLP